MFGKEQGSNWGHLSDVGTVVPGTNADLFWGRFQKDLILSGLLWIKVDEAVTATYPFSRHSLSV